MSKHENGDGMGGLVFLALIVAVLTSLVAIGWRLAAINDTLKQMVKEPTP